MRYRVTRESVELLDELRDQLEREFYLFTSNVDDLLLKGRKASLQRSRKHALNLSKMLKEFRKRLKEVKFEPSEASKVNQEETQGGEG